MNNERKRTIPSEFSGVFSVACAPGVDRERVVVQPRRTGRMGRARHRRRGGVERRRHDRRRPGNSFAAPVVAGHLARIVGAHPGITPWQARTVLATMAANAPATGDGRVAPA